MRGGASAWAAMVLVACNVYLQVSRRGAAGVEVLRFQEDRVATSNTLANYKGKLDPSEKLSSLTLCGRFFLFTLHGWATFFALLNEENINGILEADVWVERVRPVISRNWNFQILKKNLWVFRWHHLCFTYDHQKYLISTYVDGRLNNHQNYEIDKPVSGNGARVGQGLAPQRSFSGDLTQVNVWDRALSEDEIRSIAKCQEDMQGNYVSWNVGWTLQEATSREVPLADLCKRENGTYYFWFPLITYSGARYLCRALGTTLPSGKSKEEIVAMYTLANEQLPEGHDCRNEYWAEPNDLKEEGVWMINDTVVNDELIWGPKEPNGLQYENCAVVYQFAIADVDCKTNRKCVACPFTEPGRFSLLGTCESELRNVYFTAFQRDYEELIFVGYGAYHITRLNGTWTWINVVKNKTIAYLEETEPDFPMGRRWWQLEHPVCGQKAGGRRKLLLSPCPPGHYTCDDATCIPLPQRCDLKYDCGDNSDELECELVSFPDGYQKQLPPRRGDSENAALPIVLTVSVESLAVKTIDMVMEVSYQLMLTWMDSRLLYQDLKEDSTLNVLPVGAVARLWTPQVGFINTIKSEHTLMDGDTIMQVDRRDKSIGMKATAPAEVELFSGGNNTLTVGRKYGTVYMCDLDLSLYPFDVQECFMHLRISSATKFFMLFDPVKSIVNNSANRLLVEYEVGILELVHGGEGLFSEVKVRVPLTRRYGYAVLNIYLPTLVLLIVSYVTLFFRPSIFDVRMMSALTVQLVIATLFSQVSASLPKTSYFKMVDVWLIFCIGITFLTIIFHVVVDNAVHGDETPGGVRVWVSSKGNGKLDSGGWKSMGGMQCLGGRELLGQRVVWATKVLVPLVFFIFNIGYWGYILG